MRRHHAMKVLVIAAVAVSTGAAAQPVELAPPGAVNLYRDTYGVPHLYAERDEDAFFGLGYAQAEDRLPGMLLFYRFLAGELAASFGTGALGEKHGVPAIGPVEIEDMVESDIEARRLRYLADARANLAGLEPRHRRNIEAFIAGVTAYMNANPERVPAWAPRLEAGLPLAAEAFMMVGAGGLPEACAAKVTAPDAAEGSNITAIAGNRTTDGAAIFAGDSHGSIASFGTIFHPARLRTAALDAFLVDIVGLPIALKGHGASFGWAWAEGPRFPADCLAVETLPAAPRQYRFDGAVRRMTEVSYTIAVANASPVSGVFEYTRHNGVLSPVVAREGATAYVVSNAYSGRAGRAGEQFSAMLRARTWRQMDAALSRREIYPANIAIAGPGGGIAYFRPGRLPRRPDGVDPRQIIDGNTARTAWRGIRPLGELLQLRNPPQGYVTNENVSPDMMYAAPVFDAAAYPPEYAFEPGQTGTRQLRAIELLDGDRKLTFADALAFVGDSKIPGTAKWNAAIAGLRPDAAAMAGAAIVDFLDDLQAFDGDFVPSSHAALLHAAWRLSLRRMGEAAALPIESAIMRGEPLGPDANRRLLEAAVAARDWLRTRHPGAKGFGDVFRVGRGGTDWPARGLTLLPLPGDKTGESDFGSLWSSVYRLRESDQRLVDVSGTRLPFIVQFTDPVRSFSLAVPGVSDDPASPHYSDQAQAFGAAALHSNLLRPDELAAHLESARTLNTGRGGQRRRPSQR